MRDLDQAFIFKNFASDLLASSAFSLAWANKKKHVQNVAQFWKHDLLFKNKCVT